MSIIQTNDRKRYATPILRIKFTKSVDNYILPAEYSSFDICCIGGGSAGGFHEIMTSQLSSILVNYQETGQYDKWFKHRSVPYIGGSGGYVISKTNLKINSNTPLSIHVGAGGKSYKGSTNKTHDILGMKEIAKTVKVIDKYRPDGKPIYKNSYKSEISTYNIRYNTSGERSYVMNESNNEILCEADGGALPYYRDTWDRLCNGNAYVYDTSANVGYEPYGRYFDMNTLSSYPQNIIQMIMFLYGIQGGNLGGCLLWQYKGFTKGNHSFQNIFDEYIEGLCNGDINIEHFAEPRCNYSKISKNYLGYEIVSGDNPLITKKPNGQNVHGLGVTHIMNDENEQGIAGGGASSNLSKLIKDMDINETSQLITGEDGGGNCAVIKKISGSDDYQYEIVSNATSGVANTGGGGGGGIWSRGTTAESIPSADGGSGCVYIDCYTRDYRPKTRIIGKTIVV